MTHNLPPANLCEVCGDSKFVQTEHSVLLKYYDFLTPDTVQTCTTCGTKYYCCPNCTNILFPLHLALDPYGVKYICENCGQTFSVIKKWADQKQKHLIDST